MNGRCAFISFLAASPLYAGMGLLGRSFAQVPAAAGDVGDRGDGLIARAGDALDVFDFEAVARNLREITRDSIIRPA